MTALFFYKEKSEQLTQLGFKYVIKKKKKII